MASYTIVTDDAQETALTYAYDQSQLIPPPPFPPPIVETKEEFFQRMINQQVLSPMIGQYNSAVTNVIMSSLATIPEPNRPDALVDLTAVVVDNGGAVNTPLKFPVGS